MILNMALPCIYRKPETIKDSDLYETETKKGAKDVGKPKASNK